MTVALTESRISFRFVFHDLLGKLHREIISLHNGHDICPRIIDMSDNLDDFSLRLFAVFSIICDLHHNFVPGNLIEIRNFDYEV